MPSNLVIQTINKIEGDGFLSNGKDNLDNTQFTLNTATNTLTIQGCTLPGQMNSQPYGSVTVTSVQMPNYV